MITLTICYRPGVRFDEDYYLHKHLAMAGEVMGSLGMQRVEVQKVMGTVNGTPPLYPMLATIYFESPRALDACLRNPMWSGAVADIKNYYHADGPDPVVASVPWEKNAEQQDGSGAATLTFCYMPNVAFDEAYYLTKHLGMAEQVMPACGIRRVEMQKVERTLGGSPAPYRVRTVIYFDSLAQIQECQTNPIWHQAVADIPNYYAGNADPIVAFVPWCK